eukprot:TRINITY_DN6130_c0_g1_i1.p1 TRINITY_DN6130_c0_g1~~TRINITY_DN6130_c0_g1_i1.p1  ORF type:complete len:390 (+),score=50.52 TRINITY_DN6130_c0_g1_i1:52-1170(+)
MAGFFTGLFLGLTICVFLLLSRPPCPEENSYHELDFVHSHSLPSSVDQEDAGPPGSAEPEAAGLRPGTSDEIVKKPELVAPRVPTPPALPGLPARPTTAPPGKLTVDLVVATCLADTDWVLQHWRKDRPADLPVHRVDIFLYHKCGYPRGSEPKDCDKPPLRKSERHDLFPDEELFVHYLVLPNVGYEAHTYAYHMLHYYDHLADWTAFLQDDGLSQYLSFGHIPKLIQTPPPNGFSPVSWYSAARPAYCGCKAAELCPQFGFTQAAEFSAYAMFMVTRDAIRRVSRDHWEKLVTNTNGSIDVAAACETNPEHVYALGATAEGTLQREREIRQNGYCNLPPPKSMRREHYEDMLARHKRTAGHVEVTWGYYF